MMLKEREKLRRNDGLFYVTRHVSLFWSSSYCCNIFLLSFPNFCNLFYFLTIKVNLSRKLSNLTIDREIYSEKEEFAYQRDSL